MAAEPRTLVCLHGVGGAEGEWSPAARGLGDRAHLVTAVPPDGRFVLAGHSFGGVEAIALADERPQRVDGLVLTGCFFPPARGGRSYAATAWDYARHRALYLRDLAGRGRVPRPACPVLVVHGTADHVVPVGFARAAAAAHPGWTYAEVVGGGHACHRDRAEDWAAIVGPWLATLGT